MGSSLDMRIKSAAEHRTRESRDADARWLVSNRQLVNDISSNMRDRLKKHGIVYGQAEWVHKRMFDQTYNDLHDGDSKDFRVRLFFEPLIDAFDGDRKLLLAEYGRALDRDIPIADELNRVWNPVFVTVEYASRRKRDVHARRLTIRHDWRIKKLDA